MSTPCRRAWRAFQTWKLSFVFGRWLNALLKYPQSEPSIYGYHITCRRQFLVRNVGKLTYC